MRIRVEPSTDGPVEFDWVHLVACTDGDTILADLLFAEFIEHLDSYIAELLGAAHADAWRDGAHRIKGAARGIGARALAETAAIIEDEPPVGDAAAARAIRALRAHEAALRALRGK